MDDLITTDEESKHDEKNKTANESQRILHLAHFCHSSGFLKQKFSNNLINSLYFMAPERVCGKMSDRSEYDMSKADIWSVGVILFILVFGKPPFEGSLT